MTLFANSSRLRQGLGGIGVWRSVALLACTVSLPSVLLAEQIPVRHVEGVVHGFLVLRTLDGKTIADGDLSQVDGHGRITDHTTFHFVDGSIMEETTVFLQRGRFRLLNDHLVQRGPSFERPMETTVDARSGKVIVRYTDDQGAEKIINEKLRLPSDIANGLLFILLKNIDPNASATTVSMVAATPKPRLVKLTIVKHDDEAITVGRRQHKTTHFVVKAELGGVAGVVAPLVGKHPPDTHVWILKGESPSFIASEGPLFEDGPNWRVELTGPDYSQPSKRP
jgi:hypothetical protein